MLEETNQQSYMAFRQNVDSWIKDFNHSLSKIGIMAEAVDENIENTNHNYEMVQELRQQMAELHEEMKTLKLMQLLMMKRAVKKK